jgi:hypothetical protein
MGTREGTRKCVEAHRPVRQKRAAEGRRLQAGRDRAAQEEKPEPLAPFLSDRSLLPKAPPGRPR